MAEFLASQLCLNAIWENKILMKMSEFIKAEWNRNKVRFSR